jgi:hypothetical protein
MGPYGSGVNFHKDSINSGNVVLDGLKYNSSKGLHVNWTALSRNEVSCVSPQNIDHNSRSV